MGNVKPDFLKKLTHLKLGELGIAKIEALEACERLRNLYLFDNSIARIENLGSFRHLTHLYLQNNRLTKIEGLENCGNLSKLYLGGNAIHTVEGLDCLTRERPTVPSSRFACSRTRARPRASAALTFGVLCSLLRTGLEELDLSRQQPQSLEDQRELAAMMNAQEPGRFVDGGGMMFDMASIATIARSLRILELAGNGITTTAHLTYLGGLQELNLKDNAIDDKQDVEQMLSGYSFLQKLELLGNPIAEPKTKIAPGGRGAGPSYRDEIVLMSPTVAMLDGKEITMQQRKFLQDRAMMRARRKAARPAQGGGGAGANVMAGGGRGMDTGGGAAVAGGQENMAPPGLSVGLGV